MGLQVLPHFITPVAIHMIAIPLENYSPPCLLHKMEGATIFQPTEYAIIVCTVGFMLCVCLSYLVLVKGWFLREY